MYNLSHSILNKSCKIWRTKHMVFNFLLEDLCCSPSYRCPFRHLRIVVGKSTGIQPVDPAECDRTWMCVLILQKCSILWIISRSFIPAALGLPGFDEKNSNLTTPWNPERRALGAVFALRKRRTRNSAFGEIKKQLVPRYYSSVPRFFAPSFYPLGVRRWNLVETRMTSFEVPR